MWTETPSPIGPLRIVERHGAITAIEFSPYAEGDGRPRGERQDDHPVLAEQLRGIGYGETASYGAIAFRLGMTNAASRAVGLANGRNPITIVIPCHRVIGANGTLTGYAGGLERKQLLLDLERTDALF